MEQHPIPQQINSYEFKLVGEMTLKQFMKAAAGIVIALLINASGIFVLLRWTLMLIFAGGGLMLAFVPFQDRPLEQWLMAFIKAIYSPTIYTYKKRASSDWISLTSDKSKSEEALLEEEVEEEMVVKKDNSKVREFIESLPSVKSQNVDEEIESDLEDKPIFVNKLDEPVTTKPEITTEIQEEVVSDWRDQKANLNLKAERMGATATATYGAIPMPDKPDVPNVVVGMVINNEGKIIEEAIVEIQDYNGNPSRVLKTNSLGQFRTTTPLTNGKYLIITEKEGSQFDRINIEIEGKTLDPVIIKSL